MIIKPRKNKNIILASASPRRKELLEKIGLKFEVLPPKLAEDSNFKKPFYIVKQIAFHKALKIKEEITKKAIIIAADTLVYCKGELIGKPKSYKDAKRILKLLTHNPQYVYTGFCIIDMYDDDRVYKGYDKTKVIMHKIPNELLDKIIRENMDKAGCYAIQSEDKLVKEIKGDYYNVVGLPVDKIKKVLRDCGVIF